MTGSNNTARFGVSDNQITTIGKPLQDSEGVLHVLAQSNDFQVLEPIVGFVPVLVVDSHLGRNPDKGLSHEPMNVSGRFLSPYANDHLFVSVGRIDVAVEESSCLALHSDDSANAAQAADFVLRKVFNRSPFFHTCHFTLHDILGQGESS